MSYLTKRHDRLHVGPDQSQPAVFHNVWDVTRKMALEANFQKQKYRIKQCHYV